RATRSDPSSAAPEGSTGVSPGTKWTACSAWWYLRTCSSRSSLALVTVASRTGVSVGMSRRSYPTALASRPSRTSLEPRGAAGPHELRYPLRGSGHRRDVGGQPPGSLPIRRRAEEPLDGGADH